MRGPTWCVVVWAASSALATAQAPLDEPPATETVARIPPDAHAIRLLDDDTVMVAPDIPDTGSSIGWFRRGGRDIAHGFFGPAPVCGGDHCLIGGCGVLHLDSGDRWALPAEACFLPGQRSVWDGAAFLICGQPDDGAGCSFYDPVARTLTGSTSPGAPGYGSAFLCRPSDRSCVMTVPVGDELRIVRLKEGAVTADALFPVSLYRSSVLMGMTDDATFAVFVEEGASRDVVIAEVDARGQLGDRRVIRAANTITSLNLFTCTRRARWWWSGAPSSSRAPHA